MDRPPGAIADARDQGEHRLFSIITVELRLPGAARTGELPYMQLPQPEGTVSPLLIIRSMLCTICLVSGFRILGVKKGIEDVEHRLFSQRLDAGCNHRAKVDRRVRYSRGQSRGERL